MKVLVLATDYPNNDGGVSLMYIHSRNAYYALNGIDVTVLNFSAHKKYTYEGIKVITLNSYEKNYDKYDILICHAPNLRNHYKFLKKYGNRFLRFIFFFHGHEVLRIRENYSAPYSYMETKSVTNSFVQDIYDSYKLAVWRRYFPQVREKSEFIFVSEWMKNKFERYVQLNLKGYKTHIIHNNVGEVFETHNYDYTTKKLYDFITVRSNLDGSKYCIDVVNRLASENPGLKFLVIGKGKFFDHIKKADNLTWEDRGLMHSEMPEVLNSARCALMPTRLDAQGVMMCEMATYGIPVLTSDIDICQELAKEFKNFILINNTKFIDLTTVLQSIKSMYRLSKNKSLYAKNTVGAEVALIKEMENDN
ncbi:glycosyltransferase family 4 protein [bacterium 210820-DFI.6.37]|nr:glycosyltransferase family 4 protein [bacterium 210820-DFI.6.37]